MEETPRRITFQQAVLEQLANVMLKLDLINEKLEKMEKHACTGSMQKGKKKKDNHRASNKA